MFHKSCLVDNTQNMVPQQNNMRKPFDGSFKITQEFGKNPADYAKFGLKGHNGIDFGLPTGTEVRATHGGVVKEATNDPTGYGLYIKIENSIEGSLYAHLKEFKVKLNDTVTEGQVIGLSDNTGNSTGPHLHFGYYRLPRDRQNGFSGYVDPAPFFNQPSEVMVTIPQKELDEIRTARDTHYNDLQKEKETVRNLNEQINEKNRQLADKDRQLSATNDQVLNVSAEKNGLQIKLIEAQQNVENLEKQVKQALEDRNTFLGENDALRRSNAQLKRRIEESKPIGFWARLRFILPEL